LTASGGVSRLNGSTNATFTQADVVPAIELRVSRAAFFGGFRGASGMVAQQQQAALPFPGTPASVDRISARGVGPVFGGVLALGDGQRTLRLSVREERLSIGGETLPERAVSASLSIALTPAAALELGAGRYDRNRVVGTPAGEYVSAGISLRMGGAREPSLPAARGAGRAPAGTTRLSIRAPDAERVEIAGDFNEWKPVAARRADNGVWYADLRIPPGQYRYAFRVNGAQWRVPDGATAVDDGFGGKSAWLTISEPRSR
jgi:hypothetical protein